MSCKNCGQEPEGAFCPACGRSRRDDDKFCPNCGHRFTDSPAPPTDEQNEPPCRAEERKEAPLLQESRFGSENAPSKTIQSFFRCAHRIPACALGLFSALLFAFFAAPVAQTRFPRIGLGSVYTMTEVPSLTGMPFSLLFCLFYSQLPFCSFSILSAVPHSIIWRNAPFLPRPSYSTRSVAQSGSFWQTNASENGNLRKRAKAPA